MDGPVNGVEGGDLSHVLPSSCGANLAADPISIIF